MRGVLFLLPLFVCALGVQSADAPVAADPVPWTKPTKRPDFKPLPQATPADDARLKMALKAYDDNLKELEKLPKTGASINMLRPGTVAEKLGLRELDVITKFDGEEFDHAKHSFRDQQPHKITVFRYGTPNRDLDVPAGNFGVVMHTYKRPKPFDFGIPPANPKWDEHLANFMHAFQFDPEIAEVELRRALAAGLPQDAQTDAWFARLELDQLHDDRAMDFASLALAGGTKDATAAATFFSAASATFKLQALNDILEKTPELVPRRSGTVAKLLADYKALAPEKRAHVSPSVEAAGMWRDEQTLRLEKKRENFDAQYDKIAQDGELKLETIMDHYHSVPWGPAVSNLELTCSFKLRENAPGPASFPRSTHFSFTPAQPGRSPLSVWLSQEGRVDTGDSELVAAMNLWPQLLADRERIHTLTITLLQQRAEVVLDGVRIFYGPTPSTAGGLLVHVHNCGMNVEIRNLRVDELLDEAEYKERIKKDVNTVFKGGQTRLHRAAENGLLKEVGALLEAGADPKLLDAKGRNAAQLAARNGHLEVVKLLLAKGAPADFASAGALGDEKALAALKTTDAAKADKGWTALHGAVAGNQLALAKSLLAAQANANAANADKKETPLMWAARLGRTEMAALLLANWADGKLKDSQGRKAAELARWNGFEALAKTLDDSASPVKPPKPPKDQF